MPKYRPNAAVLLLNLQGKLLICERANQKGNWQFPQGGVDPGESIKSALAREVREEIGLKMIDYKILESKSGYSYKYPSKVKKQNTYYVGQTQTYFLCRLRRESSKINLMHQRTPEFSDYKWIWPWEFKLDWLPDFKKKVHAQVMEDFFDVRL